MTSSTKDTKLAVLIDAENLSPALVKYALVRLQAYKTIALKRAYGDWSKPQLVRWRSLLTRFGIHAVHAPTYTIGKNAADIMLVIDALDFLHQQGIDRFCIISNDGDFTPLVHRLNAGGAKVVGFGSAHASHAFMNACHRFIHLESLAIAYKESPPPTSPPASSSPASLSQEPSHPESSYPITEPTSVQSTEPHPPTAQPLLPTDPIPAIEPIPEPISPQISSPIPEPERAPTPEPSSLLDSSSNPNSNPDDGLTSNPNSSPTKPVLSHEQVLQLAEKAYRSIAPKGDWVTVGKFIAQLQKLCVKKLNTSFSCRLFGYSNITKLVDGVGMFEWSPTHSKLTLLQQMIRRRADVIELDFDVLEFDPEEEMISRRK